MLCCAARDGGRQSTDTDALRGTFQDKEDEDEVVGGWWSHWTAPARHGD